MQGCPLQRVQNEKEEEEWKYACENCGLPMHNMCGHTICNVADSMDIEKVRPSADFDGLICFKCFGAMKKASAVALQEVVDAALIAVAMDSAHKTTVDMANSEADEGLNKGEVVDGEKSNEGGGTVEVKGGEKKEVVAKKTVQVGTD